MNTANINPTHIYSVKDAMAILDIKRTTFYKWCNEGKLRYCVRKVNGRRGVKGIELCRCLREIY